jgi:hypothetical protein
LLSPNLADVPQKILVEFVEIVGHVFPEIGETLGCGQPVQPRLIPQFAQQPTVGRLPGP